MEIKLLASCLVFTLLSLSCTKHLPPKAATLTGNVQVNWSNQLKLRSGPISLLDEWSGIPDKRDSLISLEDGKFHISLAIDKSSFYTLSHEQNKFEIYLEAGDSLHIEMGESIEFSGSKSALNAQITSIGALIAKHQAHITQDESGFFTQSPMSFQAKIDSMESVLIAHHTAFKKQHKLSESYEQRIQAEISYRSKFYKLAYPSLFHLYGKESLKVKPNYYEKIARGNFDDPSLLSSNNYTLFLDRYIEIQAAGNLKYGNYFDASIEQIHPRYEAIMALDAHPDIKDYLLTEHLKKSISNYGTSYLKDLMPRFRKDCKDENLRNEIENLYQEQMARRKEATEIKIYKQVNGVELEAHIFYPEDYQKGEQRPAYLFFHGGGWAMGTPEWGYANCKRYSTKGMIAISFEYRLVDIHGTKVVDCIKDAKSAILWARKEAETLGIDPYKILAAGFSAGGHLAACTAILDEFEEIDETGLSSKPNALIAHSATYNTLKNDWFNKQSDGRPASISTFHQVKKGLVPAIFFHGTEDHLAPISEFTEFRDKMESLGNDFEYKIFEHVGHFFGNPKARETVNQLTEDFLGKLGYISK